MNLHHRQLETIVCLPLTGMACRMIAIINARYLIDLFKPQFSLLLWPTNLNLTCSYKDLFSSQFFDEVIETEESITLPAFRHSEIIVSYSDPLDMGEDNFRKYARQFIPSAPIAKKTFSVCGKLQLNKSVIGIHVRRTDMVLGEDLFFKSMELLKDQIRNILKSHPSQRFFVCSDDKWSEDHLMEEFSPHICANQEKEYLTKTDPNSDWRGPNVLTDLNLSRSTSHQGEALVDLLCLAATDFQLSNSDLPSNGLRFFSAFTKICRAIS